MYFLADIWWEVVMGHKGEKNYNIQRISWAMPCIFYEAGLCKLSMFSVGKGELGAISKSLLVKPKTKCALSHEHHITPEATHIRCGWHWDSQQSK